MEACSTISDRIAAAAESIRRRSSCPAATAVILGTGLGDLADEVADSMTIPYRDIPGFPHSTALAHKGRLVCGELSGTPIVMMQGRCHLYEGYSLDDVTLPVHVLAALGIKTLIVTNAAGGLNPNYSTGDVMLIDDHINLMGNCGGVAVLRVARAPSLSDGRCEANHGARKINVYDRKLAESAVAASRCHKFLVQRGVYVGVLGPTYETRAEYRAFRRIGGDCVGMSTVPEVLAAASCGLRVLGLSTVTNVATPDAPKKVSADEVVEVAAIARPRVQTIIQEIVAPTIPSPSGRGLG